VAEWLELLGTLNRLPAAPPSSPLHHGLTARTSGDSSTGSAAEELLWSKGQDEDA